MNRRTPTPPDREVTAQRLQQSSARLSYDPEVDIDWDAPLEPDKFFVPEQLVTLYGTELWQRMSRQQRLELSKQEMINTVSVGIWFETILMQMLMRLAYHGDPRSRHVHYAYTEVAEECRHSTMFGRLIEKVGGRPYRQDLRWYVLGQALPFVLRGPSMWAATLMGEEVFDVLQRDTMRDENLQPIVRAVMRIHVTEEARHVRYAREDLLRGMGRVRRLDKEFARYVAAQGAMLLATALTRPAQYARAGLDPKEARRQALANPHHQEAKRHGAERVVRFLSDADLIGGPTRRMWLRSGLLG
ncbi:AurF N-oxygenase family protein [Amycolatopsis aidingensis]|uniref:AurF N-oxygenase family protein n=1 Tax=Amycolatopsis aidingensis TaxID=2842453 RepID=UPI001C0AB07C|nr:diiron oxygenase [Amycolatopsis aidingensis]